MKGNKKPVVNYYNPKEKKKTETIVFYYSAKSMRKNIGDLSRWNPHSLQHPNLLSLECQYSDQMILLLLIRLYANEPPKALVPAHKKSYLYGSGVVV